MVWGVGVVGWVEMEEGEVGGGERWFELNLPMRHAPEME